MALATKKTDYRTLLRSELVKRINGNPAYSLRRFAQQLGVSPATLSLVLAHKRRLSFKAAQQVTTALGLSPRETREFYDAVAKDHSGAAGLPSGELVVQQVQMAEDVFKAMSDWYYYAILELTFLKEVQAEPKWVAARLGININEAADAIARLKKLGLLEERSVGRGKRTLIKTAAPLATPTGTATLAVRKRHRQILEKAITSLEEHAIDERDMTAMTMAIDPALLPEAKQRITAFRRELCAFLESGQKKRIYEMSISLFPLSKGEKP